MKKRKIIHPLLIITLAAASFIAAGCSFFDFPFERNNPFDPGFRPDSDYEEAGSYGQLGYDSSGGLPFMSCGDLGNVDGEFYVAVGDIYKPAVGIFPLSGGGPDLYTTTVETYDDEGGVSEWEITGVDDVAASYSTVYLTDGGTLYSLDLETRDLQTISLEISESFSYRYIDISGSYFFVCGQEDNGEWWVYKYDTNDGMSFVTSLYIPADSSYSSAVSGFAASADWVFLASSENNGVYVVDPNTGTPAGRFDYTAVNTPRTSASSDWSPGADTLAHFYDIHFDDSSGILTMLASYEGAGSFLLDWAISDAGTFIINPGETALSALPLTDIGKSSVVSDGTSFYITDPVRGAIYEAVSASEAYKNDKIEPNGLIDISDLHMDRDTGRLFMTDRASWLAHSFNPPQLSLGWGVFGVPGINTAGGELMRPGGITSNKEYIFIDNGNDISIQRFDRTDLSAVPATWTGPVPMETLAALPDNSLVSWSNSESARGLYLWTASGTPVGPVWSEGDIEWLDLEVDNDGKVWTAMRRDGYSSFGYFSVNVTAGSADYTEVWNSEDEDFPDQWGYDSDSGGIDRYWSVEQISVPEGDYVWVVFDRLALAVQFTKEGEMVGSFCLRGDDYSGVRWLPGRWYDFAAGENSSFYGSSIGGFAADSDGVLWVARNSSHTLDKYTFVEYD